MHPGTHRLSIDLGTATTVAVPAVPGAPPRVLEVDGAPVMPSAVFATEDGRLAVGREAEQLAPTLPARFEPSPLRRIDEGNLLLGAAVVPVANALGALLGKVVAAAAHQLGGALPGEILLTHPARWDSTRCGVLRAAAQQAGLGPHVRLVPAPVAAAAHFAAVTGRPLLPGQTLVVGDLGAGTFDVTVLAAGPAGVTMLAEAELSDLGGRDVDQALCTHLGDQVAERDPDGWQRLLNPQSTEDWSAAKPVWDAVRRAKETLSAQPSTEVALPAPFGTVPITRDELDGLLEPAVRRGAELLVTTAQRAGVGATPPAGVYLVGGASRLPLVARLVAERTGLVPVVPDQPETAVAFGACLVQHGDLDAHTQRLPPVVAPPPPGPAFGRRMGRAAIVGALSAVVVAAIVAVIVLAPWRSGTESSSEPSQAATGPNGKGGYHWSLTLNDLGWPFVGLWQADTSVVLGTGKDLTAYDVESGEELWSWAPPEDNYICTMSPATAVGLGAITYGSRNAPGGDECHHLQTISVESGEPGWDEPVSLVAEGFSGGIGELGGASLSISDSLVTAPFAGRDSDPEFTTDLTWVDTKTGERLGSTDTDDKPVCELTGYAQAVADSAVALTQCRGESGPKMFMRSVHQQTWLPAGNIEGCDEPAVTKDAAFMRSYGENMLVGCYTGYELTTIRMVSGSGYRNDPVDLSGVAVESVLTNGGAGPLPTNVLLGGDTLYLPRGQEKTSDGVIATTAYRRSWEHRLSDATEIKLMAATDEDVTVLVTTPGPAKLYTVTDGNRATEAPELDPDVADELPEVDQAFRVGDYLVCGFGTSSGDRAVIGVVKMAK